MESCSAASVTDRLHENTPRFLALTIQIKLDIEFDCHEAEPDFRELLFFELASRLGDARQFDPHSDGDRCSELRRRQSLGDCCPHLGTVEEILSRQASESEFHAAAAPSDAYKADVWH